MVEVPFFVGGSVSPQVLQPVPSSFLLVSFVAGCPQTRIQEGRHFGLKGTSVEPGVDRSILRRVS